MQPAVFEATFQDNEKQDTAALRGPKRLRRAGHGGPLIKLSALRGHQCSGLNKPERLRTRRGSLLHRRSLLEFAGFDDQLQNHALHLRRTTLQWTGTPVSVGIASTN